MKDNKKTFKYLAIPVLFILFYLCFVVLYRLLGLPATEEIISIAKNYYVEYGYYTVLAGALIEGALFINWYLPGSLVVALGVVFAKTAGLNVYLMLALVVAGFYLTALMNYALGRFGWYHVFLKLGLEKPLEKFKGKMEERGLRILFTAYVHPNFGALSATAAGILCMSFKKFALYAFISIALWNTFWTAVFYFFGNTLLNHLEILIIVAGILVYVLLAGKLKKPEEHINVP